MFSSISLPWLAALATATLTAHAEPAARTARPDPLDPAAAVPVLVLASPIQRNARTPADKPVSWREANDTVARIGGWRVYAREALQPDLAPAALPQPHGGHKSP